MVMMLVPGRICCLLILLAAPALAEPVRWSEAEGGNGRYYEYVPEALTWQDARHEASEGTAVCRGGWWSSGLRMRMILSTG